MSLLFPVSNFFNSRLLLSSSAGSSHGIKADGLFTYRLLFSRSNDNYASSNKLNSEIFESTHMLLTSRFLCWTSCKVLIILPAIISIPKSRCYIFYIDVCDCGHCSNRTYIASRDIAFCDFQTHPVVALLHTVYCIVRILHCSKTQSRYNCSMT